MTQLCHLREIPEMAEHPTWYGNPWDGRFLSRFWQEIPEMAEPLPPHHLDHTGGGDFLSEDYFAN